MPIIAGHYVVAYANAQGFTDEYLVVAVTIAKAESNWNTDYHFTGPETDQRGLWAINVPDHPEFNRTQLYDPTYNAWAARQQWLASGLDWGIWQSYLDGSYAQFYPDTDKAIADFVSLGGDPGTTVAPPVSSTPPPVISGLYPNFGPMDPAPYLRRIGDTFHDWAMKIRNATDSINSIME